MKIITLINELKKFDPNAELYFATDEEVNSIYSNGEIVEYAGDQQNYLTVVPLGQPFDSLDL